MFAFERLARDKQSDTASDTASGTIARDVVTRFAEAINAHATDRLGAMMSDNHRFVGTSGAVVSGKASCVVAWHVLFASCPEYRIVIDHIEERSGLVVVRGRSSCSVAELNGPTLWCAHVEDGLVTEWHAYADEPATRRAVDQRVWAHTN